MIINNWKKKQISIKKLFCNKLMNSLSVLSLTYYYIYLHLKRSHNYVHWYAIFFLFLIILNSIDFITWPAFKQSYESSIFHSISSTLCWFLVQIIYILRGNRKTNSNKTRYNSLKLLYKIRFSKSLLCISICKKVYWITVLIHIN